MSESPDQSRADHDDGDRPSESFRAPTRREHWIAAMLFLGFGVFFILLFFVLAGWWFRWVIIVLGIVSILRGLSHALDARKAGPTR